MDQNYIARVMFIFLLSLFLLTAALRVDSGDGEGVYQVARSMADGTGFAIPSPSGERESFGAWGVDGRYYAPWGWGASLSMLPSYWMGELCYRLTGWGTLGYATRAFVASRNVLIGALVGCVLFALMRELGYSERPSAIATLGSLLLTPFITYIKSTFSEPLLALLLALALLATLRAVAGGVRQWFLAGCALGFGLLVKPTFVVVVPAFLGYAAWTQRGSARWKALGATLAPILVGCLATGWYNSMRFGTPLATGYPGGLFDYRPWVGFYGLLLSPGKGLLWHCPLVVLGIAGWVPLAKRRPRAAALIVGAVCLFLGVHTFSTTWHGGSGWGPRYIVPIVPLLVLPLAEWLDEVNAPKLVQVAAVLLITLSMLIQAPAVAVSWARTAQSVYDASATRAEYDQRIIYRIADSPIWRQWISFLEVSALVRDPRLRTAVREVAVELGRKEALQPFHLASNADELTATVGFLAFNTFDFWWLHWSMLGAPLWAIVSIVGVLLIGLGWSGWRLVRLLAVGEPL